MIIAKTISQLNSARNKITDQKIAFVPTMGALHDGHLALVKKGKEISDFVIVSIFVNKTQFNDLSDYEKYPRQEESDLEKLKNVGADLVFLPTQEEIFANNFSFKIIPTKLTDCLCGSYRPGHFDGVALIVTKLFNLVKPNIAVFGQKDFQQLSIIKRMVHDLNFDIEIYAHQTLREKNGLAMSSRNQRLSDQGKIIAAEIFNSLNAIKKDVQNSSEKIDFILKKQQQKLISVGFEKIDYLEIRDEENLEIITDFNANKKTRIFLAAYLEGIRLIDNLEI